MSQVRPRVKVPRSVSAGEAFEIKTLVRHEMETGLRKDSDGNKIPRDILHTFVCKVNGTEVMRSNWEAAISANPYFSFYLSLNETSDVEFAWTDDAGETYSDMQTITVA